MSDSFQDAWRKSDDETVPQVSRSLIEYAEKRWPAKNGHQAGCSGNYILDTLRSEAQNG